MIVKTLNFNGNTYCFGRNRRIARGPRLSVKNYTLKSLPAAPNILQDYIPKAANALRQIYGNNRWGDCVIACMAHIEGVLSGNANPSPFIFTGKQIVRLYSAIGGYVYGDPSTDNGCNEDTALNYWESNGLLLGGLRKIAGSLAVDPSNIPELKSSVWLFENCMIGMELPDEWVQNEPSDSGFIWDVAGDPDPSNGHCVAVVGYTADGLLIDTWGMIGLLTWAAVAKYCSAENNGAIYTVVSKDAINVARKLAPNGFDWSQLVADFDSVGGTVVA